MTSRNEVLTGLMNDNLIVLSRTGRNEASRRLNHARDAYERARLVNLRFELAMHYRVAVFGSARLGVGSHEYDFVSGLTKALVEKKDVDIVTGGGPGIMEAANLGQRQAILYASSNGITLKSKNIGEGIKLSFEQGSNKHLDFDSEHREFPTRLQAFLDRTHAAYNAQGGIGTLFELLLLTQTKQVGHLEKNFPILAHPFWEPIINVWNDQMYHNRELNEQLPLISSQDLSLIRFTDKIPEIVDIISQDYDRWYTNVKSKVRILND